VLREMPKLPGALFPLGITLGVLYWAPSPARVPMVSLEVAADAAGPGSGEAGNATERVKY